MRATLAFNVLNPYWHLITLSKSVTSQREEPIVRYFSLSQLLRTIFVILFKGSKKKTHKNVKMTIARHNEILYT